MQHISSYGMKAEHEMICNGFNADASVRQIDFYI